MTVTALDPSSALVLIDLQNALVGAPMVPSTATHPAGLEGDPERRIDDGTVRPPRDVDERYIRSSSDPDPATRAG